MLRLLTMALCLPALLSGCIATYSLHSEKQFSAAPGPSAVCTYNWTEEEAFFRSDNVFAYEWAPADDFGYHSLKTTLHQLPTDCTNSAVDAGHEARLSAHYLKYVNKITRSTVAVSGFALWWFTLGVAPMPLTDHFAVCLQVITPDGLSLVGLANGSMDSSTNMWAAMRAVSVRESRDKEEQLMRDLTLQAWHKLWLPKEREPEALTSCPDELDAMVKH